MADRDTMKELAEKAKQITSGLDIAFDYSDESIGSLEFMLDILYNKHAEMGATKDGLWNMAMILGSYLGECLLRNGLEEQGFAWGDDDDGEPCLVCDTNLGDGMHLNKALPITKCYKRMMNGPEDSVALYYATVLSMVGPGIDSTPVVQATNNEPEYSAPNGTFDAMAAVWLLNEDFIFFLDDQITWDGQHHDITGMQFNTPKTDQAPVFLSNPEHIMGMHKLVKALEADEGLCIPRVAIHPALHSAILEGDLTGITLFNLCACAKALMIKQGDNGNYTVIYDSRLAAGIPAFFKLVGRMIWDMREHNGVDGGFTITFASARNIDVDQYFGEVDKPVAGAVMQPKPIENIAAKPVVNVPSAEEIAAAEEKIKSLEEENETDKALVKRLKSNLKSAENLSAANKDDIERAKETMTHMLDEISSIRVIEIDIAKKERELEKAAAELEEFSGLHEEMRTAAAARDELATQISKLGVFKRSQKTELRAQLDEKTKQFAELAKKLPAFEKVVEAYNEAEASLESRKGDLRLKAISAASAEERIEQLTESKEEASKKVDELRRKLAESDAYVTELEVELREVEARIAQREREIKKLKKV